MEDRKYIIRDVIVILVAAALIFWIYYAGPKYRRYRENKLIQTLNNLNRIPGRNDVVIRNYVDIYFNLAKIYLERKDYDLAIALYERGLQIHPWKTQKVLELAYAYKNKGMHKEAYDRFNQALTLRPDILTFLQIKWELFRLKDKSVILPMEQEEVYIAQGRLKDLTIYILPFGMKEREMLEDLRVLLQDALKVRFEILNSLIGPAEGFDAQRNQYFIIPLFRYVRKEYNSVFLIPNTQAIMIVTSFDITDKGLNFLFGGVDSGTRTGIVSYRRFLLDHPDNKLLFKRILTQSLSTAGFLLGLPRCSVPVCARSYPHSFFEFKRKSHKLCQECKTNLNKKMEELKDCPEVSRDPQDLVRLDSVTKKYNLE